MKYSKRYQTCWHDTDACRRMRPSQLLVYMQEASNHHVADTGMTLDDLRDEKKLGFILSKIQIAIYRPLVAYEDIQVQTWTCKGRGFSSPRCFRILKDGEVVAEANSQWALLGIEDRKFHRLEETGYQFEDEEPLALDIPPRIRFPAELALEKLGERRIVYSDLDYNMHMNNTRYPDMLCDYMPLADVGCIRGLSLSYLHEAAFGNVMTVLGGKHDGSYYFRTLNEEGTVCLEAQILLN
ncbi:MAG: hypothetical protein IJX94_05095 [Clostridia bacterium]|nr:hypothetical protein [Clostridia bacterium]